MEYYAYDEPVTGFTKTGESYTANQTIIMSARDATNYWRQMMHPKFSNLSDAAVLVEFITCNYAYRVYPIHKVDE